MRFDFSKVPKDYPLPKVPFSRDVYVALGVTILHKKHGFGQMGCGTLRLRWTFHIENAGNRIFYVNHHPQRDAGVAAKRVFRNDTFSMISLRSPFREKDVC